MLPISTFVIALVSGGTARIEGFLEDDASYYFLIAENILRHGRSTFDGVTTTTGYHPLWMAMNLVTIAASSLDRGVYLKAIVVLCAACALAHAFFLRRLLGRFTRSALLADAVTIITIGRSIKLAFNGMECAVAMVLLVWCLDATLTRLEKSTLTARDMLGLGLLAAFMALARIDALPFGLVCGALVILPRWTELRAALVQAASFTLGLIPFVAYLALNLTLTGTPLTTSARAKSLAPALAWNLGIFDNLTRFDRLSFLVLPLLGLMLVLSPLGPWRGPKRKVALLAFGFPVVYYLTLAIRSSWQIWGWYLYPTLVCFGLTLTAFGEVAIQRVAGRVTLSARLLSAGVLAGALAAALGLSLRLAASPGNNESVRAAALELARFAKTHPGRYAMGDRAGLTALLVGESFLQLEGLVADQALLTSIQRERPLLDELRERNIDYFVSALPIDQLGGGACQQVTEPKPGLAGALSPKMRGTVCGAIFDFRRPEDAVATRVYPIKSDATGAPGGPQLDM